MVRSMGLCLAVLALALALPPAPAQAGTQDFTLVNQTGVEIHNLFISETSNEDWEEDVLGEHVLPDGNRMTIEFHGRGACIWDLMVLDEAGDGLTWTGINLCEASVVVLRCDDEECWSEAE